MHEVLNELKDRKLVKLSPNRTFFNLTDLGKRFPVQFKTYGDLVKDVLKQLGTTVDTMTFAEFHMYCRLLIRTCQTVDQRLFSQFYLHLFSAEAVSKPLKLHRFADLCALFFDGKHEYPKELLRKQEQMLRLFEDMDPQIKTFGELYSSLYDKDTLGKLLKEYPEQKAQQIVKQLERIPKFETKGSKQQQLAG